MLDAERRAAVRADLSRPGSAHRQAEDSPRRRRCLAAVQPLHQVLPLLSYINDIANGEICSWRSAGTATSASRSRAPTRRKNGVKHPLRHPEGRRPALGRQPRHAEGRGQHRTPHWHYIDYLLDPQVAADNANYVHYASRRTRLRSTKGLIAADGQEQSGDLSAAPGHGAARQRQARIPSEVDRLRMQAWTAIKSGQ